MPNNHFDTRVKQRAIPPAILDWLASYGEEAHDHRGAVVLYFSKRSKRLLEQQLGKHFVQQNQRYLNAYMVVSTDGKLITTGWRTKKVWLH